MSLRSSSPLSSPRSGASRGDGRLRERRRRRLETRPGYVVVPDLGEPPSSPTRRHESGLVHSATMVARALASKYKPLDKNSDLITIELFYPCPNAKERYTLAYPTTAGEANPVHDIYTTVPLILENCVTEAYASRFGTNRHGILRSIMKACHTKDPHGLASAIEDYNDEMQHYWSALSLPDDTFVPFLAQSASYDLVVHMMEQSYARTVAPFADALNHYTGFSNNVYGEIKHRLVAQIMNTVKLKPGMVYLDMGSGIGNTVLQVAAEHNCESWGIEVMETPAALADSQRRDFTERVRLYNKPCGTISLLHGDFLNTPAIDAVIQRADVILVNNYAFSAELNHQILAKLLDVKNTVKIVTLKAFVAVERRLSARRVDAIESIFRVTEHYFGKSCVSWTNEGGSFFVHTVDRASG
ncbi:DOT1-domain-containing protein [Caulochytrium protostelioides]|uniref:Histone-lysine N-methyltransferase, H3 lysine-79 specific n=1 Tax=Caulochytrium protostelioides TaxID=1555241 RepID=A0A4P9WWU4_9FUNG|nr:DOT1-domain-containing protein [Caulochytrium protostelioides]